MRTRTRGPDTQPRRRMRGTALDGVLCHYFRCWEPAGDHRLLYADSEHYRCLSRQLRERLREKTNAS